MFLDKLKFALAETIHEELTARLDRASLQARRPMGRAGRVSGATLRVALGAVLGFGYSQRSSLDRLAVFRRQRCEQQMLQFWTGARTAAWAVLCPPHGAWCMFERVWAYLHARSRTMVRYVRMLIGGVRR